MNKMIIDVHSRILLLPTSCLAMTLNHWSNWKQAIQVELDLLAKRKVFGPLAPIPQHVKPVGYKWVFVRKRIEKNEIVQYKARLVAQDYSQRPGIYY